jgi:hypothetical protein
LIRRGISPEGSPALELPAFGVQYQVNPRVRDLSRLAMLLEKAMAN